MNSAKAESIREQYHISLPALYAQINEQRQAAGLAHVEPAIMAVRSTIKFSIRRGRTLMLRGDVLDAEQDDVEALCDVLSDLFSVQVRPVAGEGGRAVRVLGLVNSPVWALPMSRLYDAINGARIDKGLPTVESAVISVRTRVRYSVVRAKPLNFKDDRLIVDDQDRDFLDHFIATHFNVEIPGGVAALCVDPPTAERSAATTGKQQPGTIRHRGTAPAVPPQGRRAVVNGAPMALSLPLLFQRINDLRRAKGLQAVEPAVISVRTRVRYSIVRGRPLDFKNDRLQIDGDDRDFLDVFITQHFDVNIPGGIAALCETNALAEVAVLMPKQKPAGEVPKVWRYLTELLRLARFGPLTRVSIDRLAELITWRMHGRASDARSKDVRQRLMPLLKLPGIRSEDADSEGVVWLNRGQIVEVGRLIQHEFQIQLSNLPEMLH